jgi:aldehyde:ferredoxin oxidoreductase
MITFRAIIEVDLSAGTTTGRTLTDTFGRDWVGGRSINAALMAGKLSQPIDPLGPDNDLLLSCGLLTGTAAPASSRLHINAVSPLTGLLGSSNIGGNFGRRLRASGYDGIIVRGVSARPVCLEIGRSAVRLNDAARLWGLDTYQTQDRLDQQYEKGTIDSLVIGPAGENLVAFACIVCNKDHTAGRTGLGAVMGAKRLKAIVLSPHGSLRRSPVTPFAKAAVADYAKRIVQSADYRIFSRRGGAGYVQWAHDKGYLGARNFGQRRLEGDSVFDDAVLDDTLRERRGCRGCPVHCKAVLQVQSGSSAQRLFRPEFESMINLGAKCGLKHTAAIIELDNLCTCLGLDSTSTGTSIAFAMQMAEKGLLRERHTGGLKMAWGDAGAMREMILQMAAGTGLGGFLARGVRHAAAEIGRGADKYAAQVKGLELTAYHPAALLASALGYAISSRGGDYNNVYASLEHRWTPEMAAAAFGTAKAIDPAAWQGKGRLVHRAVLVNIMIDSLGICKVPALSMIGTFDLVPEAELTAAITGRPVVPEQLMAVAQQVATLERWINLRLGMRPDQDDLPEMFFQGPGPTIDRNDFLRMRDEFYEAIGWDCTGLPLASVESFPLTAPFD